MKKLLYIIAVIAAIGIIDLHASENKFESFTAVINHPKRFNALQWYRPEHLRSKRVEAIAIKGYGNWFVGHDFGNDPSLERIDDPPYNKEHVFRDIGLLQRKWRLPYFNKSLMERSARLVGDKQENDPKESSSVPAAAAVMTQSAADKKFRLTEKTKVTSWGLTPFGEKFVRYSAITAGTLAAVAVTWYKWGRSTK